MVTLLSSLLPPRTNSKPLSPTCCVPGRVISVLIISSFPPGVVLTSIVFSTTARLRSSTLKAPPVSTTSSKADSFSVIVISKSGGVVCRVSERVASFIPKYLHISTTFPFCWVTNWKRPSSSLLVPSIVPCKKTFTPIIGVRFSSTTFPRKVICV